MRRGRPLLCGVLAAMLAAGATAAGASAQEPRRIKAGVSAAGVDLSGLTVPEAAARLDAELLPRLQGDFVLTTAGRHWPLTMKEAGLKLDATRTAKRGLYARRPSRGAPVAVPPAISHSRSAVKAFVARVAAKVRNAPRDARVRISLRRVRVTGSRKGKALAQVRTRRAIDAALDDPAAPRAIRRRLSTVQPGTTVSDLRRTHGTVLTVDKANFRLRLFKGFRWAKTYGVAVGQPAYPTPSGLFSIANKAVNPNWNVPNSPWAGELAGTVVEGGSAANPLKARWMGIVNGVGIHGTGEEWSIGSRASHGCIRMRVADVIALYERVPVGTPVLIR
jgi:lipoprotein-anchoring transpeptidase ErfK/SrfK